MSSNAAGSGKVSTSVTVLAYAPGALIPYAARQESGGTTAPMFDLGSGLYTSNWNVFTSPYASLPPPYPEPLV